jgi:hypothetical protein
VALASTIPRALLHSASSISRCLPLPAALRFGFCLLTFDFVAILGLTIPRVLLRSAPSAFRHSPLPAALRFGFCLLAFDFITILGLTIPRVLLQHPQGGWGRPSPIPWVRPWDSSCPRPWV